MTPLILDSNLLTLVVVGRTDVDLIEKHRRVRSFLVEDYEHLLDFVALADRIVATPQLLTETSNLIGQTNDEYARACRATFATLIDGFSEHYLPSIEISRHVDFPRLGLTDCGILSILDGKTTFLTTDLQLYLSALAISEWSYNFNHLRQQWYMS